MTFTQGDRIRYECTGDDGLPLVRYGFIGGVAASGGPLVVMLDGEISGDVVNAALFRGFHDSQYMQLPSQHGNNLLWFNLQRPLLVVKTHGTFSVTSKCCVEQLKNSTLRCFFS